MLFLLIYFSTSIKISLAVLMVTSQDKFILVNSLEMRIYRIIINISLFIAVTNGENLFP